MDSPLRDLQIISETRKSHDRPNATARRPGRPGGGPRNHRLLFENETVRVLDTLVRPGQTVPLHTHQWPSTNYLLSWSEFIRRDSDGAVLLDSRNLSLKPAVGSAFWGPPVAPHTLENIGDSDLHVITVEVKQTSSSVPSSN